MLSTPAPFPHIGSFALLVDTNLPVTQQRAELVRILGARDDQVIIAFPNRQGATGNRTVALAELIDATPLSKDEERRMHDFQRAVMGRERLTPRQQEKKAEASRLRHRSIYSVILNAELAVMRSREARDDRRQGGSIGRAIPREAA